MLSGYQCEVVAFLTDGATICPDCARKEYGEARIASTELGLGYGDISPMIRYELDEHEGENLHELVQERLREFEYDHPAFADVLRRASSWDDENRELRNRLWRIEERLGVRLEELAKEHCETCGEALG